MKTITLILSSSIALLTSIQAEDVKELPITTEDIVKHLGLKAYKWEHNFDKPFDSVNIKILYYKRDKSGVLQKHEVYNYTSSAGISSTSKDGPGKTGRYPVTFIIDQDNYSFSFFRSTHYADHQWKEFRSYNTGTPDLIDGEYIFMATWKDNKSTDIKQDMLSYVAMSIEAESK